MLRSRFTPPVRGLLAAGLGLLLSGTAGILGLNWERQRLIDAEGARLQIPAEVMARQLEDGLRRWLSEAETLAALPALREALDAPAGAHGPGRDILEAVQNRSPEYAWIGLVRSSGEVLSATETLLEGANISHRPIFRGGVEGPFLGDIHPAVMLDRLLRQRRPTLGAAPMEFVDSAVAIPAADGTVSGVVTLHVDWSWAAALRDAVLAPCPDPAPELLVLSAAGRVLLDDEPERRSRVDPEALARAEAWGWAADPDWVTAAARTGAVNGHPGLGWKVVVRRDLATVLAPLEPLRLGVTALSLAVALVGGVLAARRSVRRVPHPA